MALLIFRIYNEQYCRKSKSYYFQKNKILDQQNNCFRLMSKNSKKKFQHQIFFEIKLAAAHIILIFIREEQKPEKNFESYRNPIFAATFKRKLSIYYASIFIYCFQHTTAHHFRQSEYHINTKRFKETFLLIFI